MKKKSMISLGLAVLLAITNVFSVSAMSFTNNDKTSGKTLLLDENRICTKKSNSDVAISNEYNDVYLNQKKEGNSYSFLCDWGDSKYYLDNNDLIKVNIQESIPYKRILRISNLQDETAISVEKTVDVSYAVLSVSETEKEMLISGETRDNFLTRTDEAMNASQNIRAKLSVLYDNNPSGNLFTDGNELRLISATGSYERVGAYEGIVASSSELYYHAKGNIFKEGKFVRKGSLGNNESLSSARFTNRPLMPTGYYIDNCLGAGVTYTLVCTRGISIPVYMRFV